MSNSSCDCDELEDELLDLEERLDIVDEIFDTLTEFYFEEAERLEESEALLIDLRDRILELDSE